MIVVSQVKPLLEVTKQEEKLTQKEDELKQVREKLDSQMRNSEEYERRMQLAVDEKNMLQEQLQAEVELCAEAEEMRARYNCPPPPPVLALCALLATAGGHDKFHNSSYLFPHLRSGHLECFATRPPFWLPLGIIFLSFHVFPEISLFNPLAYHFSSTVAPR